MTAGLVGEVNEIRAVSESMAPMPSSRYCGLNAICRSSPSNAASRISTACASSDAPASSTSWPWLKASRTGVFRSATRATRLTASANELATSSAVALNSLGSSAEYLGYSPDSSRVVVCRPAPAKPIRLSPPSEMDTSAPEVSARAVSPSTRAGTSKAVDRSGWAGFQRSSRTASRYRSVATRVSVSPWISILMPVSAGRVSSRPAAVATWPIAVASASLPTVPASGGISGSVGYSSSGSRTRVKVAVPHLRVARVPSVTSSTGRAGSDLTISASRRPETRIAPSSSVITGTVAWAETS